MTTDRRAPVLLLATTAGFVVWSIAFVVLYAALSVGCEFGWQERPVFGGPSLQRLQLVVLFVLHLVAGVLLARTLGRVEASDATTRFLATVARQTAIAALASTVVTFAGVFALSPCL